jgi:hypothetical protein
MMIFLKALISVGFFMTVLLVYEFNLGGWLNEKGSIFTGVDRIDYGTDS